MVAELWPSLEQSAVGVVMRSSPLLYPAVNVAHILGLMLFFSAVAMMDAKILGALPRIPAGCVLRTGRPLAVAGFLVQAASGFLLFAADAVAIAGNPAFRLKMLMVVLGLANVVLLECVYGSRLRAAVPIDPPLGARICAGLSLAGWAVTATLGRLIAYL